MGNTSFRVVQIVEFALVLLFQSGNFTNYTAVDYARKEERVTPARPRSVGRFPGPESSCNVDDGGGGSQARGQLNERLFKWPDLATGN